MELCRIATLINPKTNKFPHYLGAADSTMRRQINGSDSSKKKSLTPQISLSRAINYTNLEAIIPTMEEIMESSRAQNLDLNIQTLGPFFRITARNLKTKIELGKAEGLTRVWFGGKILHLDSIKLTRETIGMEKSIFGIGLFIGAVAIRHGYDCGCTKAELLAINDTLLYHSKLVRFYRRIGFEVVEEVKGESIGDIGHMLVWGGIGTRMDANLEHLLIKWCTRFKPSRHDRTRVGTRHSSENSP